MAHNPTSKHPDWEIDSLKLQHLLGEAAKLTVKHNVNHFNALDILRMEARTSKPAGIKAG